MKIKEVLKKSLEVADLSSIEITKLFNIPLFSDESALVQSAAYRKSQKACHGLAEVDAQLGRNISHCPNDCLFCSFACVNGIFEKAVEIPVLIQAKPSKFYSKQDLPAVV